MRKIVSCTNFVRRISFMVFVGKVSVCRNIDNNFGHLDFALRQNTSFISIQTS